MCREKEFRDVIEGVRVFRNRRTSDWCVAEKVLLSAGRLMLMAAGRRVRRLHPLAISKLLQTLSHPRKTASTCGRK